MYAKLKWAFRLYAIRHLELALRPRRVTGDDGAIVGYVEDIRLRDDRLHLRGWCLGDRVTLQLGETRVTRMPSLKREDVAETMGCDALVGFEASLPFRHGALDVTIHRGPSGASATIAMPGPWRIAWVRRRLFVRFLLDLARGTPFIIGGYRAGEIEFRRARQDRVAP